MSNQETLSPQSPSLHRKNYSQDDGGIKDVNSSESIKSSIESTFYGLDENLQIYTCSVMLYYIMRCEFSFSLCCVL